jgi:hypothetical protein
VIAWPVVVLGVGAATAYAVSATLKHVSAGQVTAAAPDTARTVRGFVAATVSHRLWLLGIAADVVGVALHVVALHSGALATVQPLLVSGLVIALVLRARLGGRVQQREIAWGVLLTASLAAFLLLADTSDTAGATADVAPAAYVGAVGAVLAVGCVVMARRREGRAGSAALLGLAVGTIDASTAAILKSLTRLASEGVGVVLGSWQLYVVVVLGAGALLVNQLAFQAGPISASLPLISTTDPLLSIVIGVVVFDETFRHGPVAVTALLVLLSTLVVSVVALTRVEPELRTAVLA